MAMGAFVVLDAALNASRNASRLAGRVAKLIARSIVSRQIQNSAINWSKTSPMAK